MGRASRRPAAVQPPVRTGACARPACRASSGATADEIADWGEPDRADLTFSVAKTLSCAARRRRASRGPAARSPTSRSSSACPASASTSAHNRAVTWTHLLTQTSEWEGTCFGMPDTVDRWRKVAHDPQPADGREGRRAAAADARQLLGIQRRAHQPARAGAAAPVPRPLPEVFRERVLRPLGGGAAFAWRGYDDAWIDCCRGVGRGAIGARRHALGRRRVDQRARPGAHRPAAARRRQSLATAGS